MHAHWERSVLITGISSPINIDYQMVTMIMLITINNYRDILTYLLMYQMMTTTSITTAAVTTINNGTITRGMETSQFAPA